MDDAALASLDVSDWSQVEPRLQQFIDAEPGSAAELRDWLLALCSLAEVIYEYGSRRNIDNACHTDDDDIEKAYLHWVREIAPKLQPMFFAIQQRFLASAHHTALADRGDDIMRREWAADVELFRPENVPLQTQIAELNTKYDKLCGAMTVEFNDETLTLQQLARYLEEPDREVRQAAWELSAERRLKDRDAIDDIFDRMLDLRQKIAANADCENYRDYIWRSRYRFDYTPQDCLDFGSAVEKLCMPIVNDVDRERKKSLNVEKYRPWDTSVDVKNRAPLRPFDAKNIPDFVEKTRQVFARIDPALAEQFISLQQHGDLDLDSRKGKRPGGFQASLEASKRPFIFMNAAGLQRDVETLVHEGGHAFHYLASRDEPNLFVRHAPLEFCEVASMSMEMLACDHYDVFYSDPANAARAKRAQLEGVIRILPWVATIDGFQHWLYTHPGHTHRQRLDAWAQLLSRFGSGVIDHSGYELARQFAWQRQGHLFHVPFYYIEYGIAQLGALGVWLNYRKDPKAALSQLLDAFALGGTAPLPDLFAAAGVKFEFSEKTLAPLIDALQEELASLPQ